GRSAGRVLLRRRLRRLQPADQARERASLVLFEVLVVEHVQRRIVRLLVVEAQQQEEVILGHCHLDVRGVLNALVLCQRAFIQAEGDALPLLLVEERRQDVPGEAREDLGGRGRDWPNDACDFHLAYWWRGRER